jgi:hypothetical protein
MLYIATPYTDIRKAFTSDSAMLNGIYNVLRQLRDKLIKLGLAGVRLDGSVGSVYSVYCPVLRDFFISIDDAVNDGWRYLLSDLSLFDKVSQFVLFTYGHAYKSSYGVMAELALLFAKARSHTIPFAAVDYDFERLVWENRTQQVLNDAAAVPSGIVPVNIVPILTREG